MDRQLTVYLRRAFAVQPGEGLPVASGVPVLREYAGKQSARSLLYHELWRGVRGSGDDDSQ